jgi:HlyD family secretion protein
VEHHPLGFVSGRPKTRMDTLLSGSPMMRRSRTIAGTLLVVAIVAGATWWIVRGDESRQNLTLYGNVDQREVSLAFNSSQRITEILIEEGDYVRKGQIVAKLDTSRLEPQVAQADAQVAAQRAVVERLRNGSRPQEIEQARANLASAKADAVNARLQYKRQTTLLERKLTSQQEVDSAKAAVDAADARVQAAQKAVDLQVVGPRQEDIVQAEAQLRASEAQLELLRRELEDTTLVSPVDGVVRARLLEAGDMASPQRPVFSLAIMDPKWIRAYVTERDLGRVRPGLVGDVQVDSFPNRRFDARVGFISPVAEFTPKNVQTEELRTSLVYEIRVLVDDPDDQLRLGMPATVHLPFAEPKAKEVPRATAAPKAPAPAAERAVSSVDPRSGE